MDEQDSRYTLLSRICHGTASFPHDGKRFSEDKSYLKGNKNSRYIHDHFIEVSATQLYIYSIIFCRRNKERETKNRYLLSDIKEKNKEAFDIIINIKAKNFIPYIKIWYYHPILSYVLRCGKLFL